MQPQPPSKEQALFGALSPGAKRLEGKTFYPDNLKRQSSALLVEAVSLLGGRIESFLHKDVSFVVTGNPDGLRETRSLTIKAGANGLSDGNQCLLRDQEKDPSNEKLRSKTSRVTVYGSRGKALLEKAIRNNERIRGNSVLANAQSWGVKILYVEDVLICLKHLTRESFSAKHKRTEKTSTKLKPLAVKAAALRPPYLKIEDMSRKYRPLHVQSTAFPFLCYSGRHSPFEPPPPPRFDTETDQGNIKPREKKTQSSPQDKFPDEILNKPSPWWPRKKGTSYCECCCETFTNLEEHLQSDQHRAFALNPSNYNEVDELIAKISAPLPFRTPEKSLESTSSPAPVHDVCELEPLTDAEMEEAVQAMQRDDCPNNFGVSTFPSSTPASPSPLVGSTVASPAAAPPLTPVKRYQSPDVQPRAPTLIMPVLTPELPLQETVTQESHALSSDVPFDLYSYPPVLSPQVPYSADATEPGSPYSDPPVLSPQVFPAEETLERENCDFEISNSLSTLLPNARAGEDFRRLDRLSCSDKLLDCTALSSSRSQSVPHLSLSPNPRKRCRSASPAPTHRKRRRMLLSGRPSSWSEPTLIEMSRHGDGEGEVKGGSSCQGTSPGDQANTDSSNQISTSTLNHTDSAKDPLHKVSIQPSLSLSAPVCIEPGLIPDVTVLSHSSGDSDWDCDLLTGLPSSAVPPQTPCKLDTELLHRPCSWMHDSGYESHLRSVLNEAEHSTFPRTLLQIVEVKH